MPFAGDFSGVNPGETKVFSIDFGPQIATGDSIASCSGAVTTYYGNDTNAATIAIGPAQFLGTIVSQNLGGTSNGFQAGVYYRWTATAITTYGATLINYGHIACSAIS
jgi:hypothetical protein